MLQVKEAVIDDERPEIVVLKLYDLGIESCMKQDKEQVKKVLNILTDSLNFDYTEIANSFCNLYKYALNVLEEDNFDDVLFIMKDLRSSWESVVNAKEGDWQTN